MPDLAIYYAKTDKQGNPVNGHHMRCLALAKKWKAGKVKLLKSLYNYNEDNIVLVDSWEYPPNKIRAFTVFITGNDDIPVHKPDIIINQQYGTEHLDYGVPVQLLGTQWFIRRKEFDKFKIQNNKKVMVISGGNVDKFEELVNIFEVESFCEYYGYEFIYSRFSPYDFAREMTKVSLVITPASISALEAISLGKPALIVRTSRDQDFNYYNLQRDLLARRYSTQQLRWELTQPQYPRIKGVFARDGTQKVINKILEVYNGRI